MRLSIRWLNQFLHADITVDQLVETLTMAGLEVEEVIDLGMRSGQIVVAQVLEVAGHPNADKLHVCQVDAGQGEPLTIVCGAPNVAAGMIVPCALEGAVMPGGMVIKKTKIRGQASSGMLCSAAELGMSADHSGIMSLPDTYAVGQPFDCLLEIKVTPNRPDCLSVLGVARDVGAMLGKKVFPPAPRFKEIMDHIDAYVRLAIKARVECPRYTCRLIRGVKIEESPLWLKRALEASGLRPINNVVDITNYVLMELGHPLHAFDFDTLTGSEVQVRLAEPGEELTIIDGTKLTLTDQDLVIADARRPVALAGVMGGYDTEVTDKTSNILLEAAYFDPGTIRKTAKRYGLQTDASYRFERGTDRQRLTLALNRATQLIQELAGGEVTKGLLDMQTNSVEAAPIVLEIQRVNGLLGIQLSSTQVADYLVNLGFEIRRSEKDSLVVVPPSHRVDITRDVDLIEEVARLHNYNNIPSTMPRTIASAPEHSPLAELSERSLLAMPALGFCEAMNYSFVGEDEAALLGFDPARLPHIANPLTVDQAIMRPSLLGGLLRAVGFNQKQDEPSIQLFELGKVWGPESGPGLGEAEGCELAAVLAGPLPTFWGAPEREADFYDLKGAVEGLLAHWGPGELKAEPLADSPVFHPGRSARIVWRGEAIGEMGEIHPDLAEACDLRGHVYALRIDLVKAAAVTPAEVQKFRAIPRYPGAWRDLAIVVGRDVASGAILDEVRKAAKPYLEDLSVFDLYEGKHVAEGQKSLALRMRLRSPEKTLTEEEISGTVDKVVQKLAKQFGATLRS